MARLITLVEQHLNKQPPTAVIQAITWWEAVIAHVKLQECGLGVHLPVKVCYHQEIKTSQNIFRWHAKKYTNKIKIRK